MNHELGIRNSTSPFIPPPAWGGKGRGRTIIHNSRFLILLLSGIILGFFLRDLLRDKPAAAKVVRIKSRNLEFQVATTANTIGQLLKEQTPSYSPPIQGTGGESLSPIFSPSRREGGDEEGVVSHGMVITIRQPIKIILTDAGNSREIQTLAETVGDFLNLEKIELARTDQVQPPLENYLAEGMNIIIDRIVDLEVTEVNDIAYSVRLEPDPETYYGREEVASAGIPGKIEQKFLTTYKNGVEIKRKLLHEKILETAKLEIRKFGTKIEIENIEEGRASWYAYKACLCAAHPSYEFARYVRVTSLVTGKSIIVKINDRGPEQAIHPERIIDLDAAAFRELAPLSSGTIAVKAELLK